MASLFDAIEANKRNSIVLLIFTFFIFLGIAWSVGYLFGEGITFWILLFIGLGYMLVSYFKGDSFVLAMSGAKPVTHEEYPFLYDIVEGMAIAAGVPAPKIYVVDDPSPNAFATGKDPKNASIAVTTGLLKNMTNQELEGVVAHEMSHIGNLDIRFMLFAVIMVGAIAVIANVASRMFIFGGGNNRRGGNGLLALIAIIFMVVAPIFAELIRLAISRQREFLADATAAKITRNPEGLASALLKIEKINLPTKTANDAIAPLYISKPSGGLGHIFSTHPPIADRVTRLRDL